MISAKLTSQPLEGPHFTLDGLRLYARTFPPILPLALLAAAVTLAPAAIDGAFSTAPGFEEPFDWSLTSLLPVRGILVTVVQMAISSAIAIQIDAIRGGQRVEGSAAFGQVLRRLAPLLLTSLLYFAATATGMLFFLIPGILLSISLILAPLAVVLDERRPLQALDESRELIRGYWWKAATAISIPLSLWMLVVGVPVALASVWYISGHGLDVYSLDESPFQAPLAGIQRVEAIASAIANVFVMPMTQAFLVSTYRILQQIKHRAATHTEEPPPGRMQNAKLHG